jgi:hypothetical protein
MNEFAKMDVFFFVTTVAVIVLTLVSTIAIVYSIKILKDVKHITAKAKDESEALAADLQDLRTNVRQGGWKLKHMIGFLSSIYKRNKK